MTPTPPDPSSSDSAPPPVAPPPAYPPAYGAPPYAPPAYGAPGFARPKPPAFRFRNVLAGLFVVGLIVRVAGTAVRAVMNETGSSGVVVNGRTVSGGEARRGSEEVEEMMGGPDGDIDKVDAKYEPKTEMGRAFKSLVMRQRAAADEFDRFQGDRTLSDLLANERLGSAAGRVKSRAELAEWKKSSATYFSEMDATIAAARALDGEGAAQGTTGQDFEKLKGLYTRHFEVVEKMLAFCDRAKPTLEKGRLGLADEAEVKRYDELLAAFNRNADGFKTLASRS